MTGAYRLQASPLPDAPLPPLVAAQVVRLVNSHTGQVMIEMRVAHGCDVLVLPAGEQRGEDSHQRRLRLVREAGHPMLTKPKRMPCCMGRLAADEGVSRQAFTASVNLAMSHEDALRVVAAMRRQPGGRWP